jgi:hypothetical protein
MKLALSHQQAVINEVLNELQGLIKSPYWKARERFQITCDLMVYSDEIPEVAIQKSAEVPNTYTVLMDGKFVCNFKDDMPRHGVMWLIYKNLEQMVKADEIVFDIYKKQRKEALKEQKTKEEKQKKIKEWDKLHKNADLSKLNDDEREVFHVFSDEKRKEIENGDP